MSSVWLATHVVLYLGFSASALLMFWAKRFFISRWEVRGGATLSLIGCWSLHTRCNCDTYQSSDMAHMSPERRHVLPTNWELLLSPHTATGCMSGQPAPCYFRIGGGCLLCLHLQTYICMYRRHVKKWRLKTVEFVGAVAWWVKILFPLICTHVNIVVSIYTFFYYWRNCAQLFPFKL